MSLALDENKLLPAGVHTATLREVEDLFGGYQSSDRRPKLCAKLAAYIDALRKANITGSVIVDGSFVMGCVDEPEDIDLILVLSQAWDMTADLNPYQYNLVSKKDIKRNFPFDVFTVREGSTEEAKWTDFFGKVGIKWYEPHGLPDGCLKGLVRIAL